MICIIALVIFSILGIFSATHRALAKEALDCVLRRVTFRPCNTGFNEKIKGKIIGKVLSRSVFLARIFNIHFELISWIFVVLTIGSTFFVIKGGYNYYLYGSCNGLNKSGFCALDPTGENNKISPVTTTQCSPQAQSEENLTLNDVNLDSFPTKNRNSENKIVFIGCYGCEYSRKAYPLIQKLISKGNTSFTYIHYPAKEKTNFLSEYVYCTNQQNGERFWGFNASLFKSSEKDLLRQDYIDDLANQNGYDVDKLKTCLKQQTTTVAVEQQLAEISKTHFYGTPTIFINGKAFVGPKPYRVYERAFKGWRFW